MLHRSLSVALILMLMPALAHAADNDGDGWDEADDCNDDDASIFPEAEETCDEVDNDCDDVAGNVDFDGDGYVNCEDCNDARASFYPGAPEECDDLDTNCDGSADDADGDSYRRCEECEDPDAVTTELFHCQDCDDLDPLVNPGAEEVCDGLDNDCKSETDESVDRDGDGYTICQGDCSDLADDGDDESGSEFEGPMDLDGDGQSYCDGDCNDQDVVLNSLDVDEDGEISCETDCDDLDAGQNTADADGDDFSSCEGDCDDNDVAARPFNEEICNDGIDNDCSGLADDLDVDEDESISPVCGGPDCDDEDPTINPEAGEEAFTCLDDLDNDCDGIIDDLDDDCWAEADVDAGPDKQQKYLGGTAILVLDGSGSEDPNPSEELSYAWTLDTPLDEYAGVTVELDADTTSPYAFLRFHADADTPENEWVFEAHLVITDPHFVTDPEDSGASVVVRVFRPTYYSTIDCSLTDRSGAGAPLALLLLALLGVRRRR